jgi:hypothetical protein
MSDKEASLDADAAANASHLPGFGDQEAVARPTNTGLKVI